MLPQKVMDLYDSDRAEGGWKPPIVDNRRREQNQKQVTFWFICLKKKSYCILAVQKSDWKIDVPFVL